MKSVAKLDGKSAPPPRSKHGSTRYTLVGWIIIFVGVIGLSMWAGFAPLDKGVPLSGTIVVESNTKAIQHLNGGNVDQILVKDGDLVKAGQVLLRLDPIQMKSAAEMTRSQYFAARALEARLTAEQVGRTSLAFPPILTQWRNDPRLTAQLELQSNILRSRVSAYRSEMAALEQLMRGRIAMYEGLQKSLAGKARQLESLDKQRESTRELAAQGYLPTNRLLEIERLCMELDATIAQDKGNVGNLEYEIAELRLRMARRKDEYSTEITTQSAEVQRDVIAMMAKLESQDHDSAQLEITSPVAGTVTASSVFARGAVILPGAKLMEIVPLDEPLMVEALLPVTLVDKVQPGLPVDLMFSAFNQNVTPTVPGEVELVSADKTKDEKTGMDYFKTRIKVTAQGRAVIAREKLAIRSGMPVDLFVKTGERTMLNYLLKPFFDRAKTSLTEE